MTVIASKRRPLAEDPAVVSGAADTVRNGNSRGGTTRFGSRIRAWMLVPPVDFALMVAPLAWRPHQILAVVAMAVLTTLLLTGGTRYRARLHLSVLDELPGILTRMFAAAGAVATVLLWVQQEQTVVYFLGTACQAMGLVILGRILSTRLIAYGRRRGITAYRTLFIGSGPLANELATVLEQHPEYGLQVDGFVDDGSDFPAAGCLPHLGRLNDLDAAVKAVRPDILLVADGNFDERAVIEAVRTEVCRTADLLVVPRMHHFHTQTGRADHIGSIPIMRIRNPNLHGAARVIKRVFDVVLAAIASVALLPVLLVAAFAVRIEVGREVIFRQVRVGRDGKRFTLLKFRTIKPTGDSVYPPPWCGVRNASIGPVGRFLRCTSIDELPQLWNILRGDMSLVGPRPEQPHFVEQFSVQFDRYADRHRARAGLTGLAQVSGLRGDTSIADRARLDNFYIENWSLWLDIKIILRTFREVFLHREV